MRLFDPTQWRKPRLDLAELAKLRWIEGYSRKQLAKKYGKTTVAIQNYFQELRRLDFRVSGLSEIERENILGHRKTHSSSDSNSHNGCRHRAASKVGTRGANSSVQAPQRLTNV